MTRTDLSERHRQNEIMDAPDLPLAHFVETLKGLGTVNAVTRSASLMWPDLKAASARHPARAIRVLDVACGGAAKNGLKVEMAGCDLSATAVTYARDEAAKAGAPIEFFVHRVPHDPLPDGYDLLMSTLFLHHLDEDAAISFLRDAAAKCRDRIVIQDLVRSTKSYWFARLGTNLLLLSDICRLDGRTSVEGAFTRREALELAREAGLAGVEVVSRLPFRYLIRWVRPRGHRP